MQSEMIKFLLILFGFLRFIPLPVLRLLGTFLGSLLWTFASRRKHIARTNLSLCFPYLDLQKRESIAKQNFILVIQSLLDRSWIWHSSESKVRSRLKLSGDPHAIELIKAQHKITLNPLEQQTQEPLVIFAPHFVGLDAGWSALALESSKELLTIFTQQSSSDMDLWVFKGRARFGRVKLFRKVQGVSEIVRALNKGAALYLLPDMDFGEKDTLFVPFFGNQAATVTSLSRFAKISDAKVVSVISKLTPWGYEIQVSSVWSDFPTSDLRADTGRMNQELQSLINQMPQQYYWVHRRFKTRPKGELSVY